MKQESSAKLLLVSLPAKAVLPQGTFPAPGPPCPQQLRHFLLSLFKEDLSVFAPLSLQLILVGEQSAPPPGLAALCEATMRSCVFQKSLPPSPCELSLGTALRSSPAQAVPPPALGLCSGGSAMPPRTPPPLLWSWPAPPTLQ